MSALSLVTAAVTETIPDPGWECPHFLPPPPPPKAPPLPIVVQQPVETYSWKENMFVRPSVPTINLEEDAELKLGVLEEKACESRFGATVAHLPYSEKDWSLTIEMLSAGGYCLVPDAGCRGLGPVLEGKRLKMSAVSVHLGRKVHLDHEEIKRRESAGAPPSPAQKEPRFVMYRTMDIMFLDPPGLASSPDDQNENRTELAINTSDFVPMDI